MIIKQATNKMENTENYIFKETNITSKELDEILLALSQNTLSNEQLNKLINQSNETIINLNSIDLNNE